MFAIQRGHGFVFSKYEDRLSIFAFQRNNHAILQQNNDSNVIIHQLKPNNNIVP